MKKFLGLMSICLFFGLAAGQYVYFSGTNGNIYPQQCTGSLEVYANTQNKAEGSVRLGILYGNDLIYASGSSDAIKSSTFKPNFTTTTFMNKFAGSQDASLKFYNPTAFIFSQCAGTNRCLLVDMKRDSEILMNGPLLLGTMEFSPEFKDVDNYSTVFEFIINPNAVDDNWSDGTVINNNRPNLTVQNQNRVYTGTVVQTPCEADTNAPQASITDYDGGNISGEIKIGVDRGLKIEMTDNEPNGYTPLVFDDQRNWTGNQPQWDINDQYGIDLEQTKISIYKNGQPLLLNESLNDLTTDYDWEIEWDKKTWRGGEEGLNATVKVNGTNLRNTPLTNGVQELQNVVIGMNAEEIDWGVENEIQISLKVVDRAKNTSTTSITFNKSDEPKLENVSPAHDSEMINLTDPVSGKITDKWAGVSGNTIVVVLSGINAEASGYKHVFSGSQLNPATVNGSATTPDYTYTITSHEDFPEKGIIKVTVYAKDNVGNGKTYSDGAAGIGSYTFTARPSCSEFQCCDDNIHITYANVNIQNGTSVLYTGSTLTIVGGSGSLSGNDFFRIEGSTGILNCGVSVAGLTFHSRKITSTRAGENGFTDTGTIIGSGNGTFIVQHDSDLIIGFMKDYVGLYGVSPNSSNNPISTVPDNIKWTLGGSDDFGTLLGVNGEDIQLGTEWLKKYVLSVEIPARTTNGYAIEYVAEFDNLQDPYNFDLSDIGLDLSSLVYTTHLCPAGLTWDFGRNSCLPSFDPACNADEVIANGRCVCPAGKAHNREGMCQNIGELNSECGTDKRWNENTRECIENSAYCSLFGGNRDEGEGRCNDISSQSLTQEEDGYIHCEDVNYVYVDGECVKPREELCVDGAFRNGSACVDLNALNTYCEDYGAGPVNLSTYECVCLDGKRMVAGVGCVEPDTYIDTDRGGLSHFDLKGYFDNYTGVMVDGTYTGNVRVVDIEGRVSDPLIFTFMIDTTPPLCYISATQSFMCTGDSAITLTMTGDSSVGYSFRWSENSDWQAGDQLTQSITTWGSYTGYVQDSAGNTQSCNIPITNPEPMISDYALAGVYNSTITVTDLFINMNISEGTGDEVCGTGHLTLSVDRCTDGVITGVISDTDTLTIDLSGNLETLAYCTIRVTDAEGTRATGNVNFEFDTLAPGCDLSVLSGCDKMIDLGELAGCEGEQEYNESLGMCVNSCEGELYPVGEEGFGCCGRGMVFDESLERCVEACDGTLHTVADESYCCKEGKVFDSVTKNCIAEEEFSCDEGTKVITYDGNITCMTRKDQLDMHAYILCDGVSLDEIEGEGLRCDELSCKDEGYVRIMIDDGEIVHYACVSEEELNNNPTCEEPYNVRNGSSCSRCGDGKVYLTADMINHIIENPGEYDELPVEQLNGNGCYPYEWFVNCGTGICYGSDLPIIVSMWTGHGDVATYRWEGPDGLISDGQTDGNFDIFYVQGTGTYGLSVSDELGNENSCKIEIYSDRLDLISPVVVPHDITGYECQTIMGFVDVTDEGCAQGWLYEWYNEDTLLDDIIISQVSLYQDVTGSQVRDVVVRDNVGNEAGPVHVNYEWYDLPLYINSGSHDLGMLLPKFENSSLVPSTGLDVLELFDAKEMSGDVDCGDNSRVKLDSISCEIPEGAYDGTLVTGAIDDTTGSMVNIYVGEYASVGTVSCTGTISDDDGNSTGYELTLEVGREGLIIGTPDSLQGTITPGESISIKGFWVQDKRGSDTGYYTTIQSRGLRNTSNGNVVPVTLISHLGNTDGLYVLGTPNATMINSAMWEANGGVEFGAESDPVLYFYRQDGANGGAKNLYSDELILSVGDDIAGGTYTGEIVFTLYDRSFTMGNDEGDGVYWNEGQNLISIVKNGRTQYTLQDKNLGAEYAYTGIDNPDTYGNYYQWGNNYGFTPTQLNIPGFVGQYSSTHRPNQLPRSRDKFYTGGYYDSSDIIIQSLWGVPQGGDVASGLLNQGPCTGGYHIPTYNQWTGLLALLTGMDSTQLSNALKLPFAGYYKSDTATFMSGSSVGTYWMADWRNQAAVNLTIREGTIRVIYDSAAQLQGNSLRCFKETVDNPTGDGWTKLTTL